MAKYGFTYRKPGLYPDHYIVEADNLDEAMKAIVPTGTDGLTQFHMQVIDFAEEKIKRVALQFGDGTEPAKVVEVPEVARFGELTPFEYFADPNGAAADIQANLDAGIPLDGVQDGTLTGDMEAQAMPSSEPEVSTMPAEESE